MQGTYGNKKSGAFLHANHTYAIVQLEDVHPFISSLSATAVTGHALLLRVAAFRFFAPGVIRAGTVRFI